MPIPAYVLLIGLRLSTAGVGPAEEPWAAEPPGLAASIAVDSLTDSPIRLSPDEQSGSDITFYNVNTRETENFFLRYDGAITHADEARMEHLFRCKRSGHMHKVDRGLLRILARLADHYQGHVFEIISAHRARPLPKVRTSKHYSGQAIDIRVRGVRTRTVRDWVWHNIIGMPIGLGYYVRENFLHVDHRPGEARVAWEQRHKNGHYHYNPRWAALTN